jgi:hypothetical protein
MNTQTIKVRTIYGKVLTIKILEQTDQYISGYDKFGVFVKLLLKEIENCEPVGEKQND